MPRHPKASKKEIGNATFTGSMFSNQELVFLAGTRDDPGGAFGQPPEVALSDEAELPPGVNEAAVRPILDMTYRLDLLEKAAQKQAGDDTLTLWAGFDKLRDICHQTLEWNATVAELKRRTSGSDSSLRRAAGAPSLHMWDPDTDIPYLGGVGSDADIVRTSLSEDGERIPLYVALRTTGLGAIGSLSGVAKFIKSSKASKAKAPTAMAQTDTTNALLASVPNALEYEHGETTSVVRCPLCGYTEVFESTKPSTKREAERKMRKHLSEARVKKEQHHILANRLKSGKAGTGKGKSKTGAADTDSGETMDLDPNQDTDLVPD